MQRRLRPNRDHPKWAHQSCKAFGVHCLGDSPYELEGQTLSRTRGTVAGMVPETRYARSGDISIAYQVLGDGPLDLVFVHGWVSHLEYAWEQPRLAHFYRRMASFARLIRFDKRGTGLSDRVAELPTLEQRMDDVRAVMDAVGSERAVLFGISEGGPMCILFTATYPERTLALILAGSYARKAWAPDYPCGANPEEIQKLISESQQKWGGPVGMAHRAPSLLHDKHFMDWWATYLRLGASPGAVAALWRMNAEIDVRHALPVIRLPTLVIQRTGDLAVRAENARYLADHIHGAKYVELPGNDHLPYVGDAEAILNEVQEFVTGVRPVAEANRMLATVLFTDIVASTARAAELGDRRWRELLEDYHAMVRRDLVRYRGHEIDTAGDGVLATFDGPTRAIRCAASICKVVKPLGIQIRAGLHTGEVETMGEKVGGIAVHIAARVVAKAGPDEVLVSSTVKDLVAGSGIEFHDRGIHALKGIPARWRLFAVLMK